MPSSFREEQRHPESIKQRLRVGYPCPKILADHTVPQILDRRLCKQALVVVGSMGWINSGTLPMRKMTVCGALDGRATNTDLGHDPSAPSEPGADPPKSHD